MSDLNIAAFTGRLTKDPEIRTSKSGELGMRFSVAVNSRRKTPEGWKDEPNFVDCSWYGKQAEAVKSYMSKGRQVAVQGALRQFRWEKDGISYSRLEIQITALSLIDSRGAEKKSEQGSAGYPSRGAGYAPRDAGNPPPPPPQNFVPAGGQGRPTRQTPLPQPYYKEPSGQSGWDDDLPF